MTDKQFLEEIKKKTSTSNLETQQNREAIRHLATEIQELKEQKADPETGNEDLEKELDDIRLKLDFLTEAIQEFTGDVETILNELLEQREFQKQPEREQIQTEEESSEQDQDSGEEYECHVCGKTFQSEKGRNGHEGGAHGYSRLEEEARKKREQEEKRLEQKEETSVELDPQEVRQDLSQRNRDLKKRINTIVSRMLQSNNEWITSSKLAENIKYSTNEIKNAYPPLKELGLVETSKLKGISLTETGKNYAETLDKDETDEEWFRCKLCGGDYKTSRGLASHLANTHQISSKDVRDDQKVTQVYRTQVDDEETFEDEPGVEPPEGVEEDFPRFERNETVAPKHWSVEDRKYLIRKVLDQSDQPLSRGEIAQKIYSLDEKPVHGDTYYNVMIAPLKRLEGEGLVEEDNRRMDLVNGTKGFKLVDQQSDDKQEEEQQEEVKEESEKTEQQELNELEYALEQNDISEREFRSYKNTLTKLIYQTDHNGSITFYDFSEFWGGDQSTIKAWRKIYQSPTILNGLRKEVCPDKSFSWKATNNGQKPHNWILKVKD